MPARGSRQGPHPYIEKSPSRVPMNDLPPGTPLQPAAHGRGERDDPPATERVVFVSRSSTRTDSRAGPLLDAHGAGLPRLLDRSVLLLLVFVALLQALSWWVIDGYQLADSVEFMERARILVRGQQMVDAGAIRPFGYSSVLVPFFVVADWLGIPDQRPVVWCICALQILLGLGLVLVVVRLGARLAGKRAGLVAGFLVGTNPVFLQYSAQAESGFAAALCIALGFEALIERGDFRRSLTGGLWLAAAFLVAYKALVIILAIAGLVCLRDRFKHRQPIAGIGAGVSLGVALQVVLDKFIHGSFGASLGNYLLQNFGSVLGSFFFRLGLISIAEPIYTLAQKLQGIDFEAPSDPLAIGYHGLQSRWFYVENLPQMIVWPAIACLLLGLARAVRFPRWKTTILALVIAAWAFATSNKGSKDFRVWIPLLPALAPLIAFGWSWVLESAGDRQPDRRLGLRRGLNTAFIAATLLLSLSTLLALNTRHFSGYWRAMEMINRGASDSFAARAEVQAARVSGGLPEKLRVGGAYNWAMYMRESPLIDLVKLPHQLNLWTKYDERKKDDDFEAIEGLDAFIVHHPVLTTHPDLMEWVNAHFEVAAALYDRDTYEDLGPLYVLVKRSGSPRARTFFDVSRENDASRFRERRQLPESMDFVRRRADGTLERAVLLGWEYREIPPDHHGWITYHWTTPTGLERDSTIVDRITAPEETNTWQNNHKPACGIFPTTSWEPGRIYSESWIVVAAARPFDPTSRFRPIGGPHRRGELIPVRLWMQLVEYDPEAQKRGEVLVLSELSPARAGEDAPIRESGATGEIETPDGFQFSGDDMVRVGAFFLPVHPAARLPDDGRPVPE